jgi:Immunity protein 8
VAVRARVKGWNLPSISELGHGDGREIPQGILPTVRNPQSFNLEVTDPDKDSGEDYFQFDVHTPETLQELLERQVAVLGRGLVVVVDEYNLDRVVETLRPLVESVEAATWEELAFRVGSLAPWEFEGWRWHADEEQLQPHRGIEAEVREIRLLRTAIGDAFSLPIEVRFGGTDVADELVVEMNLESPLLIRGRSAPGDVVVGAGRVFALQPDHEAIGSALANAKPIARAPSWELLTLALTPLEAPDT